MSPPSLYFFFFFNDTATTEIYTLSLHDALPISVLLIPALKVPPEVHGVAVDPNLSRRRPLDTGGFRRRQDDLRLAFPVTQRVGMHGPLPHATEPRIAGLQPLGLRHGVQLDGLRHGEHEE